MKNIDTAVILAAGMGTRLSDVTNGEIPKGFLNINGVTLINRSIKKLKTYGIKNIYIVTGYLSEFYEKISNNDESIFTRRNNYFSQKGSMSSLAVLRDELKDDFILLESDLIYESNALKYVIEFEKEDCILISGKTNSGDECYIEVKNDNLYKISKNINKISEVYGELVGISKISIPLYKQMLEEYEKTNINQYHYEEAIFDSAVKRKIGYLKVDDLIWAEIDDSSHLKRVKEKIIPKLRIKNEE